MLVRTNRKEKCQKFNYKKKVGAIMVKITLKIEGMSCGMCETHINDTVRRHFGVKKVSSSHSKGQTEIIAENTLDEEALRKVISETGYIVLSIKTEPYVKKGLFHR